jgi:hypothetical protein
MSRLIYWATKGGSRALMQAWGRPLGQDVYRQWFFIWCLHTPLKEATTLMNALKSLKCVARDPR